MKTIIQKYKAFSFRTQIFLASMLLIIFPSIMLSAYASNSSAAKITREYHDSMSATLAQMNLTLDTLLQNASKVADMPLLNDDVRKSMVTNYQNDYLTYAKDSTRFRNLFSLTNRLSTELLTCIFQNQYGFSFDYNVSSIQHSHQIQENINNWIALARASSNHTYFAPLQIRSGSFDKNVLPMLKIILDGYTFKEIGICYCEINFQPIADIFESSKVTGNTLMIYNTDNQLIYSSDSSDTTGHAGDARLLSEISAFSSSLTKSSTIVQSQLETSQARYAISGCLNKTTGWRLVQLLNNQTVLHVYRDNIVNHINIFLLCALLGLILSAFLSRILARPVSTLCRSIDALDPIEGGQIDVKACGSNKELSKLIISFNHLNRRLANSLQKNYEIELNKKQLKIQMLQFQINHHFLYNTLNIIKSLASIHNVPEIETIATCMSDLIRYNLEKFPVTRLEEALQQIKRYMTIQNIRFPGKFLVDFSIPPEYLSMEIPVFLLQPLVENSIEHGFSDRESNCFISITCQPEGKYLHFLVADNGSGISPEKLIELNIRCRSDERERSEESSHKSIGLQNVSQRIRSYYGPPCGLSIESMTGEGTIIDIMLPSPGTRN